jgi:hypothetical protein
MCGYRCDLKNQLFGNYLVDNAPLKSEPGGFLATAQAGDFASNAGAVQSQAMAPLAPR